MGSDHVADVESDEAVDGSGEFKEGEVGIDGMERLVVEREESWGSFGEGVDGSEGQEAADVGVKFRGKSEEWRWRCWSDGIDSEVG